MRERGQQEIGKERLKTRRPETDKQEHQAKATTVGQSVPCVSWFCAVFYCACLSSSSRVLSWPPQNSRMKKQVMTPFRAPRKTGDKTQDINRKVRARKDKQARQQPVPESEEATELGLVWPQPEEQVVAQESSNPWWPDVASNEIVNSEEQSPGKSVVEEESPRLTDYESEGYKARREARKKISEGGQQQKVQRRV